ncbi:MAG: tRNA (N(6)-L-threonylcarbamoyladenosine(37)-C(2))-methylthiotransferase MtaB [Acidobacteriota bacterium]
MSSGAKIGYHLATMRVCFTNLGCKLNQAELEKMARRFHAAGHRVVATVEEAELHVINTCTVTHHAARSSRKLARRGQRRQAELRTVLTGCYATEQPEEAAALAGVDLVVLNNQKDLLLEKVHEHIPGAVPKIAPAAEEPFQGPGEIPVPYVPLAFGNTRALVKVEDGCNVGCSFCIIPFTRGRQTSRPVDEIVEEVRSLEATGHREVVITGVQISHYRSQGATLVDLTRSLLEATERTRLRLTSIAPWRFDEELFELWQHPRLCRHIHMSLQSGCTETLRRMRRPYTAAAYGQLAQRIRREIPGVALTTDVIVGFPGETDEEFDASLAFVESMEFAKIHAFPYSRRPGTAAAEMPDGVPHNLLRQRMERMLTAAEASEQAFLQRHLGTTVDVLWERRRGGRWQGMTDNYLRVLTSAERGDGQRSYRAPRTNQLTRTRLTDLDEDGLWGIPLPPVEANPLRSASVS